MREDSDDPLYLIGDHLGSTSLVIDSTGQQGAKQTYLPFGEPWGVSAADLPTDFTFTGQREAAEIGLMYYVARWYDSEIGHFVQADTIVPGAEDVLAWNRYTYAKYNPMNYVDPSGHWTCDDDGNCYLNGWNESYKMLQNGNTCAVCSIAAGLSTLTGTSFTQKDVQPLYWWSYEVLIAGSRPEFKGWGVMPKVQASVLNRTYNSFGVEAEYSQGSREDLIQNLEMDIPTIVTFALPGWAVGHAIFVVGYSQTDDELLFFNPAYGDIQSENYLASLYSNEYYDADMSFNELWSQGNIFVSNNAMVSIQLRPFLDNINDFGGAGTYRNIRENR